MKTVALVLAAGKGKRMNADKPKQYMLLGDKPVLYYSLKTFEESFVDEVILVTGKGEEEFCRKEIVLKYGFSKVVKIVEGGAERYISVYNGLMASGGCDYVFIHDGARPFVSHKVLERCLHYAEKYKASVAAVKAKDTIKIEDGNGFIKSTPDRETVWQMQTPQVFDYFIARDSYEKLIDQEERLKKAGVSITDDTMVVKMFKDIDARLVESSYDNIKITTPEDIVLAEAILKRVCVEEYK